MLAGIHRARHLAKHLESAGWQPIVLCVDETFHEEPLDHTLGALVPESVEIVKVPAIPARLTRAAGVGDIGLRAWPYLRRALFCLLKERRVDTVFITGSPYYPMLLAPEIKRKTGVPVVLDFQDPWVSTWGASQRPLSKSGLAHFLATRLEPRAVRAASFLTSVSDIQNDEMAARYSWLDTSRMAGIPIGGDPDDFVALRSAPPTDAAEQLDKGFVNLTYVGAFWPRADPQFRALFRAFNRLRAAEPALAGRIKLNFIGTGKQSKNTATCQVLRLAEDEGAADAVREIPQRVPYLRALRVLAKSDGILLVGSDEPHYTASKIYSCLMSGRPFLSLFHRSSSAHAILSSSGGGCALAFESLQELAGLHAPLADGLRTLSIAPEALGRANPQVYKPFEASAIARRFADIFDRVGAERRFHGHKV